MKTKAKTKVAAKAKAKAEPKVAPEAAPKPAQTGKQIKKQAGGRIENKTRGEGRVAINLVCIEEEKILLVQKGDVWILPGGKPKTGENDEVCLLRELREELPRSEFTLGDFYEQFKGTTPTTRDELTARVYWGDRDNETLTGGGEISDACFFNQDEAAEVEVSDITQLIIDKLIEDGHL